MKIKTEVCWANPCYMPVEEAAVRCPYSLDDVIEADNRLRRFAPFIKAAFPETSPSDGIIESSQPAPHPHSMGNRQRQGGGGLA